MTLIKDYLERLSDFIDNISKKLLLVIITTMVATISLQVFCRYVLGSALVWPEELTIFLMAWMTFIGSGIALRNWEHIGIEFFIEKLSPKNKLFMNIIVKFIVLFFVVFLLFTGINLVLSSSHMISEALRISLVWPRLSVPIGGLIMLVHIINLIYKDIYNIVKKDGIVQ